MHRLILLSRLLKDTSIDPMDFSFDNLQNMREFVGGLNEEQLKEERF